MTLLSQTPTDATIKQLAVASHALQRARGEGGKVGGNDADDELTQLRKLMEPGG